jgi:MFS transporter, PPP family, 3-phenylpropionic acid transporter
MNKDNAFKMQYFFVFMAFGATTFGNLYFQSIGFSGTQIGIIGSFGTAIGLIALPMWGLFGDIFQSRKKLLIIMMSLSSITLFCFTLTKSFYVIAALTVVASLFPMSTTMDANTLVHLGENGSNYGKFRVWGSIGFAVANFIVGYFLQRTTYMNLYYCYVFFMILTLILTSTMPEIKVTLKKEDVEKKISGHLKDMLTNRAFTIFLIVVFLAQFALLSGEFYFAIYLKSIHAPASLIGLAFTVTGLSEIPVFIYSSKLIKKFGTKKLLVFALGVFTIRTFLYSIVKNPYLILPLQLLCGLDYAPFFAAAVNYVNDLAPNRLKSTAQSIFAIVGTNLASIAGALIGGRLLDLMGVQMIYRYAALVVLTALIILLFLVKDTVKHSTASSVSELS